MQNMYPKVYNLVLHIPVGIRNKIDHFEISYLYLKVYIMFLYIPSWSQGAQVHTGTNIFYSFFVIIRAFKYFLRLRNFSKIKQNS
jgi:hypothetical protein